MEIGQGKKYFDQTNASVHLPTSFQMEAWNIHKDSTFLSEEIVIKVTCEIAVLISMFRSKK